MATKMEMSLDDIIKQNKSKNKGGNKSGGRRGGVSSGGKSGGSPKRAPVKSNRKPGGGVIRNRSRGAISRNTGSNFTSRFSLPSHKREAFLGSNSNSSRRFNSNTGATVLIVSNLDFGVTNSDIVELFSEFGPLKSAGVHYDRSGRSLGSADLIFERRADAIKAMKQYNGVPLDGREMNIQLATSEIPSMNTVRNSRLGSSNNTAKSNKGSTNRNNRGSRSTGPSKNRGTTKRGAKPGGGPRNKKPAPPTAEELDAQLEEYVKSKVTNSEGA